MHAGTSIRHIWSSLVIYVAFAFCFPTPSRGTSRAELHHNSRMYSLSTAYSAGRRRVVTYFCTRAAFCNRCNRRALSLRKLLYVRLFCCVFKKMRANLFFILFIALRRTFSALSCTVPSLFLGILRLYIEQSLLQPVRTCLSLFAMHVLTCFFCPEYFHNLGAFGASTRARVVRVFQLLYGLPSHDGNCMTEIPYCSLTVSLCARRPSRASN